MIPNMARFSVKIFARFGIVPSTVSGGLPRNTCKKLFLAHFHSFETYNPYLIPFLLTCYY